MEERKPYTSYYMMIVLSMVFYGYSYQYDMARSLVSCVQVLEFLKRKNVVQTGEGDECKPYLNKR